MTRKHDGKMPQRKGSVFTERGYGNEEEAADADGDDDEEEEEEPEAAERQQRKARMAYESVTRT